MKNINSDAYTEEMKLAVNIYIFPKDKSQI